MFKVTETGDMVPYVDGKATVRVPVDRRSVSLKKHRQILRVSLLHHELLQAHRRATEPKEL